MSILPAAPPPPVSPSTGSAPWAAAEIDIDQAVAELHRRFPAFAIWHGEYTGSWWAVPRSRTVPAALIEAPTPTALAHCLQARAPGAADASRYEPAGHKRPATPADRAIAAPHQAPPLSPGGRHRLPCTRRPLLSRLRRFRPRRPGA